MRLVLLLLVFLCSLTVPAQAADLTIGGEFRVRAFDVNNFSDARSSGGCGTPPGSCDDHERFTDMRVRLTTSITAGMTTGVVTLDLLNTFAGTRSPSSLTGSTVPSGTGDHRFGAAGLGGSINAVGLREAYLKVTFARLTLFAGRHRVVLGHSIVFDDVADGFTVVFPLPFWQTRLSLSALKLVESSTTAPFAGAGSDTDLYLIHTQMDPHPSHSFSLYGGMLRDRGPVLLNGLIYGLVDRNGVPVVPAGTDLSTATGTLFLVGVTYDARVGPSTFSFEFDALRGFIDGIPTTPVSVDTAALLGFDIMAEQTIDLGPVNVGLLVVFASGSGPDDFGESGKASTGINLTDISPNFVLGNILVNGEHVSDRDGSTLQMGGFQGGINQGGAGLLAFKLSVNGDIVPNLNLEGAVIYAKTVDPVIPDVTVCPAVIPGLPTTGTPNCEVDDRLGWEIDLNATYHVDENLIIESGFGVLFADNAFSGLYNNDFTRLDADPITKFFLKLYYRF